MKSLVSNTLILFTAFAIWGLPEASSAASTKVAVAADFTAAAEEIAAVFEQTIGHSAEISSAATGQLLKEIRSGASYGVFIAADAAHPELAIQDGLALSDSRITYAVGKIALWSKKPGLEVNSETLKTGEFDKIAIADPKQAPYGVAAIEAIKKMGLYNKLQPKIVQGANIAAAYRLVADGDADLGLVALSEIVKEEVGTKWMVPQDLYSPILQQAVLLKKGEGNPAAQAFMTFLKGSQATQIIRKYGYEAE